MSAPDAALLPPDPAPGAPVFAEPWHAEVLAIAYGLTRAGMFTTAEWTDALGAEIRRRTAAGEPDSDAGYYSAALAALERLCRDKSPETGVSLDARVETWRRAYLNTPHGRPVTLAAGAGPVDNHLHDHEHDHRHDR